MKNLKAKARARSFPIGVLAIVGIALSAMILTPHMASAASVSNMTATPAPAPVPTGLTVAITDLRTTTASLAVLDYLTTVTNTDPIVGITGSVVVTVPTYSKITDAGSGHLQQKEGTTQITWPLDLAKGSSRFQQHFSLTLGTIPAGVVRVSTLANVYQTGSTVPTIGTADSDLVSGEVDTADAGQKVLNPGLARMQLWIVILGGFSTLIVIAILATALRRRSRNKKATQRAMNNKHVHRAQQ